MRKLLLALLLLAVGLPALAASPYVVNSTSATFNVPATFNQAATFNLPVALSSNTSIGFLNVNPSSTSIVAPTSIPAGGAQIWSHHINALYNDTGHDILYGGVWIDADYKDQRASSDTAHGGGLFVQTRTHAGNSGFGYSGEFSIQCEADIVPIVGSIQDSCIAGIDHVHYLNASGIVPTNLVVGRDIRVDALSVDFNTNVFSSSGSASAIRYEMFGFKPGLRFIYQNLDNDLQTVTAGNVIKIAPNVVTVTTGTTVDISHALGGVIYLQSSTAGIVTLSTNSFTTPSATTTDGSYNKDGVTTACNVNLVAGRNIVIPASGNVLTKGAGAVTLTALNAVSGCIDIISYPTAGVWYQK